MNKSQVYAKHKTARTSVKKVAPVMDLVRGKNLADARRILQFSKTKASDLILKVLESAVANARNNMSLNEKDLFVSDIYASEGLTMKRGRIVARSRTSKIFKRTAHLVVGLSERASN